MNTHDHARHRFAVRWVRGILAIFALLGFGFGSWLSRLPGLRDQLEASTFEMSVFGLCLAIGSVLGLLLSGRSVTWLGPKRTLTVLVIAQLVTMPLAATLLWTGLVVPGAILLACFGFAFSTSDVAMNVSGAAAERALGLPRMPVLHAGFSLGSVSAMGIGALAEWLDIPIPAHLTVVFLAITVAVLLALRVVPSQESSDPLPVPPSTATGPVMIPTSESPVPEVNTRTRRGRSPFRDPRILLIGLIAMSMSLAEGVAADWMPLALADGRGLANATATLILGVFFVTMTLTRLVGAPLLTRFGRVPVLRGSAVLCVVGVVAVILIPATWGAVLGAVLWGIGAALGFPVGISAAADNTETATRDVAAVSAIAYTAFLLGPMSIGFLGEYVGLLAAFWLLVAVVLISAFAASAAREPDGSGGHKRSTSSR